MEVLLFGLPIIIGAWVAIIVNWRWGALGLAYYTPFTGPIIVAMYPSPLGTLMRDLIVVVPLYISYFLLAGSPHAKRVPVQVLAMYGALLLLVLLSLTKPTVPNAMVAGIGTKVWLFYIPLLFIGAAYARDEFELRGILRTIIVTGWIPWIVGLIMIIGAVTYDYEATMTFFYGEYAKNVMGAFHYMGAFLYRITGSFQYNSQYGVFCWYIIFPLMMLMELERTRGWRMFLWLSLGVGMIAGFSSGARGNFLFMPMVVIMIQMFRMKSKGMIWNGIMVVGGLGLFLAVSGLDGANIAGEVANLTSVYGREFAAQGLMDAVAKGGLFGLGAGTNTGAARHGMDRSELAFMVDGGAFIENFYGKAVVELGVLGFFVMLGCYGMLFLYCLQMRSQLKLDRFKGVASGGCALIAFSALVSFKGWTLDVEPMNYYFYLTIGLILGLPYVERQVLLQDAARRAYYQQPVRAQAAMPGVPQPVYNVRRPVRWAKPAPGRRMSALPALDEGGRPYGGYGRYYNRDRDE
jgi:hypothetical protein